MGTPRDIKDTNLMKSYKDYPGDTRTQQKLRAKNAAYKRALSVLRKNKTMSYDKLKKQVVGDTKKSKAKQAILRSPQLQGIKQAYDEIMGKGTTDSLLRSREQIAYESMQGQGQRSGGPVRKKAKKPVTYNY